MSYLWAIPVFLLLIGIHEWGHFLGAKASGIRVRKFAIGFGPRIAAWERGETEYSLRLLPLGGFVLMDGMEEAEPGDRGAYLNAPKFARFVTILAGPLMNFVLGFLLFCVVAASAAQPYYSIVDKVNAGSAAQAAGLQSGDQILEINGHSATLWKDLNDLIGQSQGQPLALTIQRGQQVLHVQAQPRFSAPDQRYLLGITAKPVRVPISASKAIQLGWTLTWDQVAAWGHAMSALVHRQASINDLSGPVGIVKAVGQTAQAGLLNLLGLTAMISMQLGLFNLLPIPVLDGAQLVFILWEAVRGRRPDPNRVGMIQLAGAILLLGLVLVITYSEVTKLFLQPQ